MPDHYPRLHTRPRRGWVNDPNGIGFWDGRWHVMMQWNPHGTAWAAISWAHLSSPDLLHWTEHPAALAPRPGTIDAGGAWSGVAAVDDAGRRVLVYSATPEGPDEVMQVIARPDPDRPNAWIQPDTAVLPSLTREGLKDVRDPFLFEHDGRRLVLLGARQWDRGAVLLFDAADLDHWEPLGTLLDYAHADGGTPAGRSFWECPQLVRIGDAWVLVVSWALDDARADPARSQGVTAFVGDLVADGEGYRFEPRTSTPLDHGPDFYAPQLVVDGDRVLAWGWSWEGKGDEANARPQEEIDRSGWAGTLTFPRELVLNDARLPILRPAAELAGLRSERLPVEGDGGCAWLTTDEPAWTARMDAPWSLVLENRHGVREAVPAGQGPAEVWVDGSMVEIFDETGAFTVRVYPAEGESWLITATGTIEAHRLGLPG